MGKSHRELKPEQKERGSEEKKRKRGQTQVSTKTKPASMPA